MPETNKVRQPELKTLVGLQVPKRYSRMFIDYLTDAQLTRLAFLLFNQKQGEIGSYSSRLIQQEFDRRGLQHPATWRKLPFDNEAQRTEWEFWEAIRAAKQRIFPKARAKATQAATGAAESKPAKKRATKKA